MAWMAGRSLNSCSAALDSCFDTDSSLPSYYLGVVLADLADAPAAAAAALAPAAAAAGACFVPSSSLSLLIRS